MKDYKKEYYEQSCHWDHNYLEIREEKERIEEIIKHVPFDVQTVLDVGCGNGAFVNNLVIAFPDRFDSVTGLDQSEEALKHVKTNKFKGSISILPFEDESFDLVTSIEVLEHLPQEDFEKGISELQRVSKKYIIITVPNDQDLDRSLVTCPKCHCWFNSCFHMRSFNENSLRDLFYKFKSIKVKGIGPIEKFRPYNFLVIFDRALRKPLPPKTAICPQCGYQYKEKPNNLKNNKKHSALFLFKILFLFKPLVYLISPIKKKKRWLLALYKKEK